MRFGFTRKGVRDGGERELRTWHSVGPKLGWPILPDRPQNRARLTTYKAGRPANRLGLWPGHWDKRPKMPAPPLKGALLLWRKRSGLPALRLCLLLRSQSLAAPSPGPKDGRAAFLLAAVGREIPAGAEAAWNHRNDTVLGEVGGIPRPRPPTCLVLFPKLGVALSPWVLGIWGRTACPPSARCGSSPRLLPIGWDPRGAEGACVKSQPLLLQILHHFRTASIYPL